MSRREKGRLAPFVPLTKMTIASPAWRALSHGARSLYLALKARYNNKLQNGVYLSTRKAEKELGSYSHRDNIRRWFRELEYYGVIKMITPGYLGLEGKGKAPHWRLTEEWYLGHAPTRDFLNWGGEIFHEQKSPKHYKNRSDFYERKKPGSYSPKKQNPGPPAWSTVDHPPGPVLVHSGPPVHKSGPPAWSIETQQSGPPARSITSLTTPCPSWPKPGAATDDGC